MTSGWPESLAFDRLHIRHFGVTRELAATYAQAAAVCLDRHFKPPVHLAVSANGLPTRAYSANWDTPDSRTKAAWANRDDATRDGAYGLTLAAADRFLGLVAYARAATLTGADYLVRPGNAEAGEDLDLEGDVWRLEVSGIDRCDSEAMLRARLNQKVNQTRKGKLSTPALAGVVGFSLARIAFRYAEDVT